MTAQICPLSQSLWASSSWRLSPQRPAIAAARGGEEDDGERRTAMEATLGGWSGRAGARRAARGGREEDGAGMEGQLSNWSVRGKESAGGTALPLPELSATTPLLAFRHTPSGRHGFLQCTHAAGAHCCRCCQCWSGTLPAACAAARVREAAPEKQCQGCRSECPSLHIGMRVAGDLCSRCVWLACPSALQHVSSSVTNLEIALDVLATGAGTTNSAPRIGMPSS
jgi:hypothetical protein